jgi:Carboxypeptidase regulatory-like domain
MLRFVLGLCLIPAALLPDRAGAQRSRLSGTVIDSLHGAPLVGAVVTAAPGGTTRDTTFHAVRTDRNGRFTLEGMPPGSWTLSVEHSITDSIGIEVPPRDLVLPRDAAADVTLAFPSAASLRRAFCPAALSDTALGVILGLVRGPRGNPARGARVVFTWDDYSVDATTHSLARQSRAASVTTDSLGAYRACGLPTATSLFLQVQAGDSAYSGVFEERISEAGVLVRYLSLDAQPTVATRDSRSQGRAGIAASGPGVATGTVSTGRAPLAGAHVRLFGTDREAITDAKGSFRLIDLPAGTQGFEVTALGYSPRRFRADVSPSTPPVAIRLDRLAAVLDSVRVTARRQQGLADHGEFEQRRTRGFGRYVTRETIDRTHPFVVSDMLRMMGGFGVSIGRDGKATFSANRGVGSLRGAFPDIAGSARSILPRGGGSSCPTVYVNGVMQPDSDVNAVLPDAVYGIEIYRQGEVPAKYRSLCGTILIWTR